MRQDSQTGAPTAVNHFTVVSTSKLKQQVRSRVFYLQNLFNKGKQATPSLVLPFIYELVEGDKDVTTLFFFGDHGPEFENDTFMVFITRVVQTGAVRYFFWISCRSITPSSKLIPLVIILEHSPLLPPLFRILFVHTSTLRVTGTLARL